MAKVRFIGDPSGDEHRRGTSVAGTELPLGEWIEMDDAPARKLLANPHFEVEGVEPAPIRAPLLGASGLLTPLEEVTARRHAALKAVTADAQLSNAHAALKAEHVDLLAAFAARGAELNEAQARIAELEAALANAAGAAQGEGNGRDADGPGKSGAEEDSGARSGAGGRRRGSASS
ncbi:hypothetical protein LGM75_27810 [Burkholderia multivorans]|uniref:hypothetical protein n=1 Tax=Burkholderia multivorans TaxID=87883 RepID=UPI001C21E50D|nr:hypothetical protein [Burkholderia multivorans]MBU9469103.1 hypothetical protein [Burkholderia multivorans]MCA8130163.1 hypothetical protein [Burkholderia multivorans]